MNMFPDNLLPEEVKDKLFNIAPLPDKTDDGRRKLLQEIVKEQEGKPWHAAANNLAIGLVAARIALGRISERNRRRQKNLPSDN